MTMSRHDGMSPGDNIMARLTAPGVAAIGVIAVWGPQAIPIVASYLRSVSRKKAASLSDAAIVPYKLRDDLCTYGQVLVGWFDDNRQRDQVVIVIRAGHVFPIVEIHCHGGPAVTEWIMNTLRTRGIREVEIEDWLRATVGNSVQQAVLAMLPYALTYKTAAVLLDQFHGAWCRCVSQIEQLLVHAPAEAQKLVARLQNLIPVGRHLCFPFQVALAGAPNAGKSTLLNALLGYTRAVTSPQPGTTRDVVSADTALEGWPIRLLDTAGWRKTEDALELAGINKALKIWSEADLVLWVMDVSNPPVWPPIERSRCLFVLSKIDLEPIWRAEEILHEVADGISVSAKTGRGLENLARILTQRLIPAAPEPGEAVPFTPDLCAYIEELHAVLQTGNWEAARRLVPKLYDPGDRLLLPEMGCIVVGRSCSR